VSISIVVGPGAAQIQRASATRRPRVATRCKWARIEALMRNRAFVVDYASARERWRNGIAAVFPAGTYWLQRFASVPVLET
jgi:REP-associated tyrosine transposase